MPTIVLMGVLERTGDAMLLVEPPEQRHTAAAKLPVATAKGDFPL